MTYTKGQRVRYVREGYGESIATVEDVVERTGHIRIWTRDENGRRRIRHAEPHQLRPL